MLAELHSEGRLMVSPKYRHQTARSFGFAVLSPRSQYPRKSNKLDQGGVLDSVMCKDEKHSFPCTSVECSTSSKPLESTSEVAGNEADTQSIYM